MLKQSAGDASHWLADGIGLGLMLSIFLSRDINRRVANHNRGNRN